MPVSFKCECGKDLRVKDEFAGKKVKCPSCNQIIVTPEITAEDLVATEGIAEPEKSQSSVKCLTCGAELKDEEPVCMKCGTIRQVMKTQEKTQSSANAPRFGGAGKPFYMKPATWIAGVAIIICGILIYNTFINQSEDESAANKEEITPDTDTDADAGSNKPVAPKQSMPEKLFTAELQNKDVTNLDKMVEHIIKLREKSVPVLGAGMANTERDVKLKSLYGLYILAYFKCYRSKIQPVINDASRRVAKDEELSRIALETLYLLTTDQPEDEFLKFTDIAGKYTEQFKGIEKSPPAGSARDIIIKQFIQNQSSLVKAEAFAYLVLLGDKWNVRQIINMMKDVSEGVITSTKAILVELTGCAFAKQEDWNKWYSGSKSFPRTRWLINSLEQAPEEQRRKTIKKLIRITGKDFSYPANATEDQKKEVINKWKELGKTLK